MAIFLALREFQVMLRGQVVQIFTDNTMPVCYLNKQGGVVSHSSSNQDMGFLHDTQYHPMVTYLPGVDNTIADAVSRGSLSTHEMSVSQDSIDRVFL